MEKPKVIDSLSSGASVYAEENKDFREFLDRINSGVREEATRQARPERRVDLLADEERAKLVDDGLGIVNRLRKMVGLDTLKDLPLARRGEPGACLLANALGNKASVGGSGELEWTSDVDEQAIAEEFGSAGRAGGDTFSQIVSAFDGGQLDPYALDESAYARWEEAERARQGEAA